MAKFLYKLQNILDVKLKLEEQAKNEYAIKKHAYDMEVEAYEQLQTRRERYEQMLQETLKNRLILRDITTTNQAIKTLKTYEKEQKKKIDIAFQKLETARIKMSEAMVERKTHEKLKEHAFESFKKELIRTENKEVDELVSYKYNKSDEG